MRTAPGRSISPQGAVRPTRTAPQSLRVAASREIGELDIRTVNGRKPHDFRYKYKYANTIALMPRKNTPQATTPSCRIKLGRRSRGMSARLT